MGFTIFGRNCLPASKVEGKIRTLLAFLLIYLLRLYWGIELHPVLKGAVAGGFIGGIIVLGVKGSGSANKNE